MKDRDGGWFSKAWGRGDRLLALGLVAGLLVSGAADAQTRERPTPSGLPVPRWVSLKYKEVNARQGPGDDYPALWTYRAKGLPVQVVAETREWRKICDPEGGAAWVQRRLVDGVRTVFRTDPRPLPLLSQPKPQARVKAYLAGRAIASFDRCENGWCRVKADGVKGWAPAGQLWGVSETARCR